jgi:hypothetical protein
MALYRLCFPWRWMPVSGDGRHVTGSGRGIGLISHSHSPCTFRAVNMARHGAAFRALIRLEERGLTVRKC